MASLKNKNKTILIVDDEVDYLTIAAKILRKEGYNIICAENGTDGMKLIEKKSPDLLLLDIGLPDVSGIEICKKLKNLKPPVKFPIILFTVRSELNYVGEALKYGAKNYIIKPFDMDKFVDTINSAFTPLPEQTTKSSL